MSRSIRKGAACAAILTSAAMLASACGSSSSGKAAATAPTTAPKASVNQINPVDRSQLQQGGTFTWPITTGMITQFNGLESDGLQADTASVLGAIEPTDLHVSATGVVSWNTNFVLDGAITSTSPAQVVTVHLNPKAHWSDGTPITAADYIQTWKENIDPNADAGNAQPYQAVKTMVQGKDQFEIIATFAAPYADWQQVFGTVLPASTIPNADAFNKGWLSKIPLTSGPFKLGSIDTTAQTITVVPDPTWWGDKPLLDKIVFKVLDTSAVAGAYANGTISFDSIGPDGDAYKQAKAVANTRMDEAGGPNWRHITFNGTSTLLSDVNVRKALFEAIDRKAIADSDLQGLNWPTTVLNNHVYVNNQAGYEDNTGGVTYNPTQAAADLDAAGWKLVNGVRTKNGVQMDLNFVEPSGVAVTDNEAKLLQSMWSSIGVKMHITDGGSKFFDDFITPGKFDVTAFSWIGGSFAVGGGQQIYQNPTSPTNIGSNFTRIGSPAIDALFTKAEAEPTLAAETADANAADKLVWQEFNEIPLYQRPDISAVNSKVANFGAFGFADVVYENIGFTK